MSMMYPGGQGVPGANQFMVGGQPNYAGPLVNFSQLNPQQQQKPQPQQPGGPSAPSGPNSGGKAPGQNPNMANFAAKLRAFFQPGGQQPGASNPAGFGPSGMAGQTVAGAPGGGAPGGFGGGGGPGASMMQPVSMAGPASSNFNLAGF